MPSLAAHFTMTANLQTKTTGIKEVSFTVTVCSSGQIIFLSLSTLHSFISRHSAIDPAGKCRREACCESLFLSSIRTCDVFNQTSCHREMEMKLNGTTAFSLKGLPLLSFSCC